MNTIPEFADLPLRKGNPHHSAWGLYGDNDELGFLNRLTEDVVLEAAKEIKTGTRISLDCPLDAQGDVPFFGHQAFHKNVYQKPPRIVNDDVWTFNTQGSSQCYQGDGLRHYACQKEKKFYNGVTLEDMHGEHATNVNGIHAWSEKGIVGRGILLDWHSWRLKNNIGHEPFRAGSTPLTQLQAVARDQKVDIKFGDILLVRSGSYLAAYKAMDESELSALSKVVPPPLAGVEQSEEVLQWIWENFSAVAGDQPSFESSQADYMLHEVLLAGWGCPIGELFDLEALAEHCAKEKRWSFFLTSKVCNMPGGVASPPIMLAIF